MKQNPLHLLEWTTQIEQQTYQLKTKNMNNRKYYTVKIPNPNSQIQHALDVSIGDNDTQRYSLDKSFVIIKTTPQRIEAKGIPFDTIFPPGLTTELTYTEALILMQTNEWQEPIQLIDNR